MASLLSEWARPRQVPDLVDGHVQQSDAVWYQLVIQRSPSSKCIAPAN